MKADPPNQNENQGFLLVAKEKLFFSPYFNLETNFFQFGIDGREGSTRFIEAVSGLMGLQVEPLER